MIQIPTTPKEAHKFFSNKNMGRLIQRADHEELVRAVNEAAIAFPFEAVRSNLALTIGGVDREGIKGKIILDIEEEPEKYNLFLKILDKLRSLFPNERLRKIVLDHISQYEFGTFCAKRELEKIFPSEYFRERSSDILENEWIQKLYLLIFSDAHLESLPPELRSVVSELIGEVNGELDVEIGRPKEPGFACGGLEDNFLMGIEIGVGLIRVNRVAIAKLMHRKRPNAALVDDGLKLTYLFGQNHLTRYDQAVWGNFVYASSKDQHLQIAKAIEDGKTDVEIKNWRIRPVRPLRNTLQSKDVFRKFEENH